MARTTLRGMKRTQFGKRYGVTGHQVTRWARQGVIQCYDDGSVQVALSDRLLKQRYTDTGK